MGSGISDISDTAKKPGEYPVFCYFRERVGALSVVCVRKYPVAVTNTFYLQKYMQTEYLTMWEASKVCSYSQEYLSLLARKRLLRAVKKENKWLTTIPWLTEYLADKKPDEVIISRGKAHQLVAQKRGVLPQKYVVITLAIFFVSIIVVAIFSQMSKRISLLEAENSALSRAQADALAGFDPSVLETFPEKGPPESGSKLSP